MQELAGRLGALDPEAGESLKVIAYFDALVNGRADAAALLRGAAVLTGCAVGVVAGGLLLRIGGDLPEHAPDAAPQTGRWPEHTVSGTARVWLERAGSPHANDDMVLERLALALAITLERSGTRAAARRAVDVALDANASADDRAVAASRLRLDPHARHVVIAVPVATIAPDGHQSVLDTRFGRVRAVIRRHDATPENGFEHAGIGMPSAAHELPESFASSVLALRLTTPREPMQSAEALGLLPWLLDAADHRPAPHPDVVAVGAVAAESPRALDVLEALASTESVRAAAASLGLHHSTVQARAAEVGERLGFDPRTPSGRTRLLLAVRLHVASTVVFADGDASA
ncbi:helix-turn-helix domain-containing protein [Plantibacter sp. YIM 135249]|uniref:helix-turn-helix domain-containing protein n=1 Tax=Plantibacter sp. YIM 135249 TaxID=3423918 RepID=UPI003D33778A